MNKRPGRPFSGLSDHLTQLIEGRLWLQVIIGLLLGIATGVAIGPTAGLLDMETSVVVGNWLAFPGRLFLVTIQMVVVPLVFASIVRGLTGGPNMAELKRVGAWVSGFFLITTALAATLGIQITLLLEPGNHLDLGAQLQEIRAAVDPAVVPTAPMLQNLPDIVIDMLPGNPLNALVEGQMLQIVLFAFIIGLALISLPESTSRPLADLMASVQEVCMAVVRWAMTIAPFAVFGLMAQLTSRTGLQTLIGLTAYVGTVLLGLVVLLGVQLAFVRLFSPYGPRSFLGAARELLLLAFSTSSSAAVMPLSMKTAVEKFRVRPSVAQLVIPLGATINMNGTALYQAVAAVFLAQVFGVEMTGAGLALIVAMAIGASIGSPATPGVGIVILASILAGIGVPSAGIALIIGVDRILDMCRTAVNVSGDVVACIFADRWVLGNGESDGAKGSSPPEEVPS